MQNKSNPQNVQINILRAFNCHIQNNNYLTIFYIPALIIFFSAKVLRKESIAV